MDLHHQTSHEGPQLDPSLGRSNSFLPEPLRSSVGLGIPGSHCLYRVDGWVAGMEKSVSKVGKHNKSKKKMIGGNNNLQQIFPNVDSILLLLVFLFVELIATYSKTHTVSEKHVFWTREVRCTARSRESVTTIYRGSHSFPCWCCGEKKLCNISILKMHDSPFHRAREITGSWDHGLQRVGPYFLQTQPGFWSTMANTKIHIRHHNIPWMFKACWIKNVEKPDIPQPPTISKLKLCSNNKALKPPTLCLEG